MKVIFSTNAKADLEYWKNQNPKVISRIEKLIADIKLHPFTGIGKPEPLRFQQTGYWSRRIDQQHRLVYKIADKILYIVQCRYHY